MVRTGYWKVRQYFSATKVITGYLGHAMHNPFSIYLYVNCIKIKRINQLKFG